MWNVSASSKFRFLAKLASNGFDEVARNIEKMPK